MWYFRRQLRRASDLRKNLNPSILIPNSIFLINGKDEFTQERHHIVAKEAD